MWLRVEANIMRTFTLWTAAALTVGAAMLAAPQAQQARAGAQRARDSATALTALDYAEIQQLYAKYAFAYDTASANGDDYARLFTADGAFNFPNGDPRRRCDPIEPGGKVAECKGAAALAKLARGTGETKGRLTLSHVTTNIVIEPSPEGAKGKAYLSLPGLGPQGGGMRVSGLYEDTIVKTSEGWKFKLRVYTPIPNPQRQPTTAQRDAPAAPER
jgi:hypothetical protein